MGDNKIIKAEIQLSRIFFPKGVVEVEGGEYAIFLAKIVKPIENCEEFIHENPYFGGEFYDDIKLKGNVCDLNFNDTYEAQFTLAEENKTFGKTFGIKLMYKKVNLTNKKEQKTFLSNIINSQSIVDELFDTYDDVISILENEEIDKLVVIKGVKEKTAQRLINTYKKNKDLANLYSQIEELDISSTMINKLIKHYKSPDTVAKVLLEDPYRMTEIKGIGFKKADEIAMRLHLEGIEDKRVKSCLMYVLYERAEEGKSYLHYQQLMDELYNNLGFVPQEQILKGCSLLMDSGDIVLTNDNQFIGLTRYFELEKNIYNELLRINNASTSLVTDDVDRVIAETEDEQGFEFTDEQKECIKFGSSKNVIAITGSAGTGKSTVARALLNLYKGRYGIDTCALSGKASVRITEATGYESSTIHRLLGLSPNGALFNKDNPLPSDVVLLDEATMVNGEIFLSLLKAIKTGSKLILLGDVKQLTPIGSCQVFADILNSKGVIPVFELKTIHRQAQRSGIIPLSLQVSNQKQFINGGFCGTQVLGELQDMELIIGSEGIVNNIMNSFEEQYKETQDIMETQILIPVKTNGDISCYNLNNKVQQLVNPRIFVADEPYFESQIDKEHKYKIYVGDKVINTKNNYKCVLANSDNDYGYEEKISVFNGNLGIVKEVGKNYCIVDFIGIGVVKFSKADMRALELAYACSVHKCLPKNTLIYTDKGIKQLGELDNGADVGEFKRMTNNIKVYNGQCLESPSHFYNNGKDKCNILTTKKGYEITATLDHRLYVLNEEGNIVEKTVQDISTSDYLLIRKNQNIYGNRDKTNLVEPKVRHNAKKYNVPTELNEDFGEFLGLMLGDGTIFKKGNGIRLLKHSKDVVDRFRELVSILFGYEGKTTQSRCDAYECTISSSYIAKVIEQIKELLPNNKEVPKMILESNQSVQCAFLRGLFEDGYVRIKNGKFDYIELTLKDKSIINTVKVMLLNMGIVPTIKNRHNYSSLYLYKREAMKYAKLIGYINKNNENKLAYCFEETNRCSKITYPYITKIVNNMLKRYNIELDQPLRGNIYREIRKNHISDTMLLRLLQTLERDYSSTTEYQYLNYILDSFVIDKVSNISSVETETYCLTMPKTHSFVQDGILGMNCQGSGFNNVIIGIDYNAFKLLNTEMLYTALTRAKKHCTLVGNPNAIRVCVQNREVAIKQTYLNQWFATSNTNK